jgi:hypothetical protein
MHRDAGYAIGLVEFLVDQGHGLYPVLALLDGRKRRLILEAIGLRVQEAHDHLQIVFDSMVDLLEQPLFLLQQPLQVLVLLADLLLLDLEFPWLSLWFLLLGF